MTDFPIDDTNLMTLMRGARARWKIENETFNTLKNQGYHCEHNFGHGHQHLSTVLMHLMRDKPFRCPRCLPNWSVDT